MSLKFVLLRTLSVIALSSISLHTVAEESPGTVLITGANRGIGLALAQRFGEAGYQVIGTARNPAGAKDLNLSGARLEQLDVTDQASVNALAERLEGVNVDILVNNAGIKGQDSGDLAELDMEKAAQVLNVNTLGPLRVIQALLPNLKQSTKGVVANISSMMGSMELNTWGCCLGYRASKAALNSLTTTLALDYRKEGLIFVTLHPGYVKTDMNDGNGNISAEESAAGLFKVISGMGTANSGKFYDFRGKELAW